MTVIRRTRKPSISVPATVWIFILLFVVVVFLALLPGDAPPSPSTTTEGAANDPNALHQATASGLGKKLRHAVQTKREELKHALQGLAAGNLPHRLKALRDKHEIIGERLVEIQQGKETAEEILHGGHAAQPLQHHKARRGKSQSDKPPLEINEVIAYLDKWIHSLHETLGQVKHATFDGIWKAYHDLAVKTLYPWDQDYLQRMPDRREDGSIFLSLASYRDEHCLSTLTQAYEKALNPDKLFVGLVQQNCHKDCKSGVLQNLTMVDVPPDEDCHKLFCASEIGSERCDQVRLLDIDEPESLGPYAARYFASKLWNGEAWFMQIDAHMTFANNWDATSVNMLQKAPSDKPILSHYPPAHTIDLDSQENKPGSRLCGPVFATSDLENQIIRLEGGEVYDKNPLKTPAFAPFTAAGYLVAHSSMLKEVPFDPFLPWIFMGEEIIMSSRLWTSGYDIFSPSRSVVGHWYVRRHKPKFWESVHRSFTNGVHNPLQMMVLDRIKYQLGYPEAALDMLPDRSILTAVESYSMGSLRPLKRYLKLVGLNMTTKQVYKTEWCEKGYPPPGFEKYNDLYPEGVARKTIDMKVNDDDEWGDDDGVENEERPDNDDDSQGDDGQGDDGQGDDGEGVEAQ